MKKRDNVCKKFLDSSEKSLTFHFLFVIICSFSIETSRRSAVGSALRSGRKGRGFESRRLDQNTAFMQEINA